MGDFLKKAAGPASIATTIVGGFVKRNEAERRANELTVQARQDKLKTQGEQIARTRRLNAILGSQIAAGSAGGVNAFSGSRANIGLKDAEQAALDRDIARAGSASRRAALARGARNERRRGRFRLGASLFKAAFGG